MLEYKSIFKYKDVYVMPKKISITPQGKNTVSSGKKKNLWIHFDV